MKVIEPQSRKAAIVEPELIDLRQREIVAERHQRREAGAGDGAEEKIGPETPGPEKEREAAGGEERQHRHHAVPVGAVGGPASERVGDELHPMRRRQQHADLAGVEPARGEPDRPKRRLHPDDEEDRAVEEREAERDGHRSSPSVGGAGRRGNLLRVDTIARLHRPDGVQPRARNAAFPMVLFR